MKTVMRFTIYVLLAVVASSAAALGKVSYVEGKAFLLEKGKEKALRVNQKIDIGDQIRTDVETIVEITYDKGTVVRIGEKSQVSLTGSESAGTVDVKQGKVWANVQKMASGQFRVSTPVATAAVRGTVFRVESGEDSSATIALYEGKVDVGPADTTKIKAPKATSGGWGPPVQVPGPYEVTMDEWIRLEPGKEINVRWGGKYATSDIDAARDANNRWILFNQNRDKQVSR